MCADGRGSLRDRRQVQGATLAGRAGGTHLAGGPERVARRSWRIAAWSATSMTGRAGRGIPSSARALTQSTKRAKVGSTPRSLTIVTPRTWMVLPVGLVPHHVPVVVALDPPVDAGPGPRHRDVTQLGAVEVREVVLVVVVVAQHREPLIVRLRLQPRGQVRRHVLLDQLQRNICLGHRRPPAVSSRGVPSGVGGFSTPPSHSAGLTVTGRALAGVGEGKGGEGPGPSGEGSDSTVTRGRWYRWLTTQEPCGPTAAGGSSGSWDPAGSWTAAGCS